MKSPNRSAQQKPKAAVTKKLSGGGRHFTHPDYGIGESIKLRRIHVRLSFIDENGDTRIAMPTWAYHSEASRKTALSEAYKERDRLLSLPEYQAYIKKHYADPSGQRKQNVRPYKTAVNASIPNLNGLFVKVYTKAAKLDGRPLFYVNIVAHGPQPSAGRKYRAWSIKKYGLNIALEKASSWRAKHIGSHKPSHSELTTAEAEIRKMYRIYLSGEG